MRRDNGAGPGEAREDQRDVDVEDHDGRHGPEDSREPLDEPVDPRRREQLELLDPDRRQSVDLQSRGPRMELGEDEHEEAKHEHERREKREAGVDRQGLEALALGGRDELFGDQLRVLARARADAVNAPSLPCRTKRVSDAKTTAPPVGACVMSAAGAAPGCAVDAVAGWAEAAVESAKTASTAARARTARGRRLGSFIGRKSSPGGRDLVSRYGEGLPE